MNYAYPPNTRGDVIIEAVSNDVRLKFTIVDRGKPFDPTVHADVDTTLAAEDRSIGGLGIYLVRQIMDSINYERIDNLNVLTLRKKLAHTSTA
jgi:sigma-B regulation protein RsbU (phosphoserine phosphatase)